MKLKHIFLILSFFILTLFSSCTDEPSSLGVELIGSENISARVYDTAIDTIDQSSSYFKKVIALGSADWVLIGKYQDIKASALMRFVFGLPDSLKNDLKAGNINVLDSWIILRSRYVYTDSMAAMNFTVHKVNSSWSATAFTIDSLSKLDYEPTDVSSQFTPTDTLYTFHLDGALPLAWMKNTADKTLESNYGIYLDPTLSSTKVIGFQAFNAISAEAAKLFVVIEKPGVYVDTLNGFIAADISLVDRPNVPTESVVINKAEIFITPDSVYSVKVSKSNNSLRLSYLRYADSLNTEGNPSFLSFKDNKYSGDITLFVRNWISRKENNGILIEAGSPTSGLEFFALKGSDYSEFSERPRLRITYTVR
ncbi:MAG: hypothetical protein MUC75_03500 [Ignavibacteriaceae bacterium]|nr:hypothetical protein [Ignavibacteriaceae bacterium]